MKKVKLFKSRAHEFELLETSIRQKGAEASPLRILEAGCGRKWPLNLSGIRYTITGVDMDEKALEFRKTKIRDLDETILGDLRSVELNRNGYDVIYNSFVLEHVQDAEQVLNNFSKWLKAGGILILRIPDRNSVYGFATRVTPFWFHVFVKKYIQGIRDAGKPGFEPYPTFHEAVVSRDGVHEYCMKNRYVIKEEYGQGYYLEGKGVIATLTYLFVIAVAMLSLGKLQWKYNNLTYILEKK